MKDRIVNSVLSQTLFIVVSGIIAILLVPILIKMLGKIEYGAFELIASLMIINFLLEFGMGSTLVKFIPQHKENQENLQTFIWSYFYIKLSVTLLGCLLIIFIGYYFDSFFKLEEISNLNDLKISVYIFALGILFSSISTFLENILKGFVYFGYVNLAKTLAVIQFFILFYGYYLWSDTFNMIEIALLWFTIRPLISIVNALIVFYKVKLLPLLVPRRFDYSYIKETLSFLFGMSYITIVAQLYNTLPKIILGIFSGPIFVGYWGIMDRIKKPLLDIQSATLRPLIPLLSDKKYHNLSKETIFQASRLNYFLISFLATIIIVNVDTIIHLWIGEEFQEVSALIKVLLLPFIFPNVGVFLMMYYARGKTKINSFFLTFNTTISISLATILLILYNQINYFVYAYTFTLIFLTFILLFVYINYFKLNLFEYIQKVLVPMLILILSALFLSSQLVQLFPSTLLGLLLSLAGTSIIYIILYFIFMPKEDVKVITSLLQKRKPLQ